MSGRFFWNSQFAEMSAALYADCDRNRVPGTGSTLSGTSDFDPTVIFGWLQLLTGFSAVGRASLGVLALRKEVRSHEASSFTITTKRDNWPEPSFDEGDLARGTDTKED